MLATSLDDSFIAIIAIVVLFGAPVAAWIATRAMAHKERMEMIRAGMMPPPVYQPAQSAPPRDVPRTLNVVPYTNDSAQRRLNGGIVVAFVGLALTIGLSFIGYDSHGGPLGSPSIEPGPWLLGGLVPLFVGIAQIITAVLSGARIGGHAVSAPGPQQSSSERFGPMPPSGSPPYGWRPGTTPEIPKPVNPPDVRQQ
jgi:uncharacterized protein DUF6249